MQSLKNAEIVTAEFSHHFKIFQTKLYTKTQKAKLVKRPK